MIEEVKGSGRVWIGFKFPLKDTCMCTLIYQSVDIQCDCSKAKPNPQVRQKQSLLFARCSARTRQEHCTLQPGVLSCEATCVLTPNLHHRHSSRASLFTLTSSALCCSFSSLFPFLPFFFIFFLFTPLTLWSSIQSCLSILHLLSSFTHCPCLCVPPHTLFSAFSSLFLS